MWLNMGYSKGNIDALRYTNWNNSRKGDGMGNEHIVTVYYPAAEWEGDLMVQKLKEAGIPAYLGNRESSYLLGGVGKVEMEILVPEEKAREARELIDGMLSAQREEEPDENR